MTLTYLKSSTSLNYVSMPDGQHHQNSAMILAGRACCASASAIAIPASYTYVAEIASSDSRGFLGCFLSVGWSFGLVLSYALGSILRWNWLAMASSGIPVIQLVVLSAVNPSPRWLVAREKMAEARKSIGFFRGKFTKHAECELMDCQHQLKEAKQVKQWQRLKMMVASSGNRRAILLCLGLYLCSVVTGYNVVNYHAKTILTQAKVSMVRKTNCNLLQILFNIFFDKLS